MNNKKEINRKYQITIHGTRSLIMHNDNYAWDEKITEWRKEPENKKLSNPGDDRSPAWSWIGRLYYNEEFICMNSDNIMTMLREGGGMVLVKGKKTFKSQTQSGIISLDPDWEFYCHNHQIPIQGILDLEGESDFSKHVEVARSNDFELFIKRAKIGRAKHIRVRPMFHDWKIVGKIMVVDEMITESVLNNILEMSGKYKGLCDWRPGSPTPGKFGTFYHEIKELKL